MARRRSAIRKRRPKRARRRRAPLEFGRSEVIDWGADGVLIACGTLLGNCLKAAAQLREEGLDIGVINARFIKPLDTETILRAVESCPLVVTVEEGALMTGFGSAVLEAVSDAGLNTSHVRRLGIPDRFIEHGERGELLAALGLDTDRHREHLPRASRRSRPLQRHRPPPSKLIAASSSHDPLLHAVTVCHFDRRPLIARN